MIRGQLIRKHMVSSGHRLNFQSKTAHNSERTLVRTELSNP
jgi:hypothetical protein